MEEKVRFNVIYMDEAVKFLESLDEKVRGKIAYNIGKWDTDEETLVIAANGFVKKTQKTPLKEIAKAEELRKLYFNSKK